MKLASLELCKQLYELSGWDDTFADHNELVKNVARDNPMFDACPAYDLGYLLRKLPRNIDAGDGSLAWLDIAAFSDRFRACYLQAVSYSPDYPHSEAFAVTPEDALAKLAIQLFKAGVLK